MTDPARTFHISIVGADDFDNSASLNVLRAMEQACARGIDVGCRSGGCGVCRSEVLAGTYTERPMSKAHVPAEDRARGVILACRIIPTSDLVLRPLGRRPQPLSTTATEPGHETQGASPWQ